MLEVLLVSRPCGEVVAPSSESELITFVLVRLGLDGVSTSSDSSPSLLSELPKIVSNI